MGNLCYRIVTAVLHACDFIHSVTYLPDFRNIHYEIGDIERDQNEVGPRGPRE